MYVQRDLALHYPIKIFSGGRLDKRRGVEATVVSREAIIEKNGYFNSIGYLPFFFFYAEVSREPAYKENNERRLLGAKSKRLRCNNDGILSRFTFFIQSLFRCIEDIIDFF